VSNIGRTKCLMCGDDRMSREPGSRCRECGYVSGGTIILSAGSDDAGEIRQQLASAEAALERIAKHRIHASSLGADAREMRKIAADYLTTTGGQ
jgi:hypothetical protein